MSLGSMLHVDLKKYPCRHVELRGRGPYIKFASMGPRAVPAELLEQ